ncbi:hypothetical protein E6B08_05250 [Pseudomonas putida]|uniref:Bulb-type lectin domain-containing protein n=1 Tax=Pseudomonas putida TaxID=303 RepID=A0A4D6X4X4_PSEPU|nr:hypothetical protein E6B08_05250 [Pseudomonas putida]
MGKYRKVHIERFRGSGGVVLPPNQAMHAGDFIKSPNGRYALRLRPDGNLVLEDRGVVIWLANEKQQHSYTFKLRKREALHFIIQNSGFLYDPSRGRIWSAQATETRDTSYWRNNHLAVTDTGNIEIYDGRSGEVRWARTGFVPGRLRRREKIFPHVDLPQELKPVFKIKHDFP